ncbi:MAG: L,D-transpeptidase [Chthoniobacterales bacterium]
MKRTAPRHSGRTEFRTLLARIFLTLLAASLLAAGSLAQAAETSIEIDLHDQTAYLIRNGRAVLSTPICSGRYGHLTDQGTFKVMEKERSHFSTLYGRIEDANGNTVVTDADSDMKVPRGGKFVPAPMRYFMRFNNAIGMHAGYLPGYPASHGCVRLPEEKAIAFFKAVEVGTPVTVFGRTPRGREMGEARLQRSPRRSSPNDSRGYPPAPWWVR